MRIVIAGGSGFLGSALKASLRASGCDVTVLTRRPRGRDEVAWDPLQPSAPWVRAVDGADAVVNLAGESLEAGRWTTERKAAIRNSRIEATRAVVSAIDGASQPPAVLLNGSAVGIYGNRGDEPLTETSPVGSDFLASVAVGWEAEALRARRTRVVILRTGLVLDAGGGVLPPLARPFKWMVGGRVGSGLQYWSWIHIDDWVRIARWAIDSPSATGPVNLTAPNPVTNSEFAATLGRVLRRPALLPAPAFALRLLLGEMADALVLGGQRVLPERVTLDGFRFGYSDLEHALRAIYQRFPKIKRSPPTRRRSVPKRAMWRK